MPVIADHCSASATTVGRRPVKPVTG